jgi:hypothetical protein
LIKALSVIGLTGDEAMAPRVAHISAPTLPRRGGGIRGGENGEIAT